LLLILLVVFGFPPITNAATRVPFQRGFTVGEWGETAYKPRPTKQLLHRLATRYHVDTVTFFVVWMQKDSYSNDIHPGYRTARTRNVVEAMRAARSTGLRVVLRPYIDLDDGGWRGQIQPRAPDRWFASYRQFLQTFARLAQREHAAGFVVGSEMPSISRWTGRWRATVARVRRRFKGFVTYQANWNEADKVTWWDALDAISISAYYPLSLESDPTVEDLAAGWRSYTNPYGKTINWYEQVNRLRLQYQKPVVFGEIGYRAVQGTATKPWETGPLGAASSEAQARAYEAAFRVWYHVPWFRGFDWWYASPQNNLVSGLAGADHRPAQQALGVLRHWYRQAPRSGG
jgi:hypothetical protein